MPKVNLEELRITQLLALLSRETMRVNILMSNGELDEVYERIASIEQEIIRRVEE